MATLFLLLFIPPCYRYRMVTYRLIDQPRPDARRAMRESRAMMHRNRFALFRLDLSLWWFYALDALALLISYVPMILSLLGISLPMSDGVSEYLFLGIYYVLVFLVHVWLRNYCEVVYVKAYDRLRTPDAPPKPVILGNIFQM